MWVRLCVSSYVCVCVCAVVDLGNGVAGAHGPISVNRNIAVYVSTRRINVFYKKYKLHIAQVNVPPLLWHYCQGLKLTLKCPVTVHLLRIG